MMKNILFVFVLFFSAAAISYSQDARQVDQNKTIVWTKVKDGYRVQLIRESDHEYILKTPIGFNEGEQETAKSSPTGLYDHSNITASYRTPEIQTNELVRSRLQHANVGMPLDYSASVKREVDRLLVNRRAIELALGRAHYFMPHSENVVNELGLPKALLYLPLVESSFRPNSRSHAGACGIWQFMSATARLYGLEVNRRVDHRFDPQKSTKAAMVLLRDLYEEFDDWYLALAAYNAGPGRVMRAIRLSGKSNPSFWEIDQFLPRETRNYIPKFIAAVYVMEHVDQIGLLPDVRGYESVKEKVESLQQANFARATQAAPSRSAIPANSTLLTYTVKKGDNLGFIAEWYDVRASELRGWNKISGNLIRAGQQLKVYVPSEKKHIYADINKLTMSQKEGKGNNQFDDDGDLTAYQSDNRKYITYKVQSGDTLWDISRKNGISITQIKQLNDISNTTNLKPGMVIKIREKS